MTSKERFISALNFREPDRTPVDFGATAVTGISHFALHRLRQALGLAGMVKVDEPYQMLGEVDEDVRRLLNIDIVGINNPANFFGFKNEGWKKWKSPHDIEVLVAESFNTEVDAKGDTYMYPCGDKNAKPSAVLVKKGYYFENLVRQEPFDEEDYNGRADFSEQFTVFDDDTLRFYEAQAEFVSQSTEYGAILNFGGAAIGDAAFLPGPALKRTPGIRRMDDWYMAHLLYPDYIKEVFDLQIEVALENLKLLKQAVGEKVQAVFLSGTDFGTQRSEFISPDMFREFYKPYYKKVNDWVHENTGWKTFYHCCGSVVNLLDDFVDMGMDILNPVQCSANGMDAAMLKRKYGRSLVFWGGGVDTQKTLPFGTAEEVKAEVTQRLKIFGEGGGFIFNTVHNIQPNTPTQNMLAMFEAIKNYK